MSEPSSRDDVRDTVGSPSTPAKAPWQAPKLEEVDYSATEASGVGGVYDFVVYSGSTGP